MFLFNTGSWRANFAFAYNVESPVVCGSVASYGNGMWASELAEELGIEQSVLSKRLAVYRAEVGQERSKSIDGQTADHQREMHRLLATKDAKTAREAVLRVLGKWTPPVGATEAGQMLKRLEQLEETLGGVERMVSDLHGSMQRKQRDRQQGLTGVSVNPEPHEAGSADGLNDFGAMLLEPQKS